MANCDLYSRDERCNNNQGGIVAIYLLKYDTLPSDSITISNSIITSINGLTPTAYKFPLRNTGNQYSESQDNDSSGNISWKGSLSVILKKISATDNSNLNRLVSQRPKIIVEYTTGLFRLMGIEGGTTIEVSNTSAGDLGGFQGYNLSISSIEPRMAPFIIDMNGLGIIIESTIGELPPEEPVGVNAFVSRFRTTQIGEVVTLPYEISGSYSGTIDWGDGTTSVNSYNGRSHIYDVPGDYRVVIEGVTNGWSFNNGGHRNKILFVEQWGNILLGPNGGNFFGCTNLDVIATDVPDLSSITNIENMFRGCTNLIFKPVINTWDTSNITNMSGMFNSAINFNRDIGSWDTSSVTNMRGMFYYANSFNQDLNGWDTSSVEDMSFMFFFASDFNQDLNTWDTSSVTNMEGMFGGCEKFNGNISSWDTGSVTDMSSMFEGSIVFNRDISSWDTSSVINMGTMFSYALSFNRLLNIWDVSNVTDMSNMFEGSETFNQHLNEWDVSSVVNMSNMFSGAINFNGSLANWDTSSVVNMSSMFRGAVSFVGNDLSTLDVGDVINFSFMFNDAINFNGDISSWDTSSAEDMRGMFRDAIDFNQNLSGWTFSDVNNLTDFMSGKDSSNYSPAYYDALLNSLAGQTLIAGRTLDMGCIKYTTNGSGSRSSLINSDGWIINDCGITAGPTSNNFVSTWRTTSNNEVVTLPYISSGSYAGNIDWGDGSVVSINSYFTREHKYAVPGDYTITVSGLLEGFSFKNSTDFLKSNNKLINIIQWGILNLGDTDGQFINCSNLDISATDTLDLTGTLDLGDLFKGCINLIFNDSINTWDVSNITNMSGQFHNCRFFNQPLDNWDTSSVKSFCSQFKGATVFNQDTSNWDMSSNTELCFKHQGTLFNRPVNGWDTATVTTIESIFARATDFNQPVSSWDTSSVIDMNSAFKDAFLFNQDLSSWDTSSAENMSFMFNNAASFVDGLSGWTVSNVTNMSNMFNGAELYNEDLSSWEVSGVTNFNNMFQNAINFNGDVSTWDISNANTIAAMFKGATSFNQDLSGWDVSNITSLANMFDGSLNFDSDITGWDVGNVVNFSGMFKGATSFNQDISTWDFTSATSMAEFMSDKNTGNFSYYDALLISLSGQNVNTGVVLDMGHIQYTLAAQPARDYLVNVKNWVINDGGTVGNFTMVWRTTSSSESIELPLAVDGTYSGTIHWGDGTTSPNTYANRIHTYILPGDYTIEIEGQVKKFNFDLPSGGDKLKLINITHWGNLELI